MPNVTIYHNPRCSKSRQTLALLQKNAIEPHIIEYLETPPSSDELKSILKKLNLSPRELLRKKEDEYKSLGLDDTSLTDEALITAMIHAPKLIERPIVICGEKAAIGRPPETVLAILNQG